MHRLTVLNSLDTAKPSWLQDGSDNSLSAMQETRVQSLGWEDPLEKEMATHSSTLFWKTPWMEEPVTVGSQRVRHDRVTSHSQSWFLSSKGRGGGICSRHLSCLIDGSPLHVIFPLGIPVSVQTSPFHKDASHTVLGHNLIPHFNSITPVQTLFLLFIAVRTFVLCTWYTFVLCIFCGIHNSNQNTHQGIFWRKSGFPEGSPMQREYGKQALGALLTAREWLMLRTKTKTPCQPTKPIHMDKEAVEHI